MDCPKCVGRLQPFEIKIQNAHTLKKVKDSYAWHWGNEEVDMNQLLDRIATSNALSLDKCFVCEGIWFDKGELEKLAKLGIKKETISSHISDSKLYKQLNEKSGLCPCCKIPMRKIKGKKGLHKVVIDLCGKCNGIWLDGGEANYAVKGSAAAKVMNIFRYIWHDRFLSSK